MTKQTVRFVYDEDGNVVAIPDHNGRFIIVKSDRYNTDTDTYRYEEDDDITED